MSGPITPAIPAKAEIRGREPRHMLLWIPAFAGMTMAYVTPAIAQHQGHSMPMQEAEPDLHAGHEMPMAEESDPHAGHIMPMPEQPEQPGPHGDHTMPQSGVPASALPQSGPPTEALSGPEHAADTLFPAETMAASRETLRRNQGGQTHSFFGVDRLEAQIAEGGDAYLWETNFWYGGDLNKLWVKTEGEGAFGGELEEAEIQALWSHAIGPYFDLQTGIRYDIRPEPDRGHAVLGVQGLAPYFFEIDAAAFLSTEGDITARIEAEYDQRITQRLILQPRAELNLSAQDIPEIGLGSGVSSLEAGLRLRYEISPQFAPYIGVEWQRDFGDTADFTRAEGGDTDRIVALAGVRFWF